MGGSNLYTRGRNSTPHSDHHQVLCVCSRRCGTAPPCRGLGLSSKDPGTRRKNTVRPYSLLAFRARAADNSGSADLVTITWPLSVAL
jgi:hypothetical protein